MKVEDKRTGKDRMYCLDELTSGTPIVHQEDGRLAIVAGYWKNRTAVYVECGELSGEANDKAVWKLANAKTVIEN